MDMLLFKLSSNDLIMIINLHLSSTSHTDTSMTYCQSITQTLRIIWVKCITLSLRSKTQSNTSAPYLDLLLSIESDGQLRTSLYDKRDDFNFYITNFPFLSSNIPSSLAYSLFIAQLIRYARACSSYKCFILRAARLSSKLLGQGYIMERLKSSLRKFYGRYGDLIKHYEVSPLPNVTWHSGTWPYTMTPSIDQTLHQLANVLLNWTLLPILTLLPNVGGFDKTLQRVRLANRGRLLLRTPGPVPFGTCICSYVETILCWTCHVYGPFEFRTSLGTVIYGNSIYNISLWN